MQHITVYYKTENLSSWQYSELPTQWKWTGGGFIMRKSEYNNVEWFVGVKTTTTAVIKYLDEYFAKLVLDETIEEYKIMR